MIAFLNTLARIQGTGWDRPIRNFAVADLEETAPVDIKAILPVLAIVFSVACLFFGTQNGFYDSDDYHGNGSAH